MAVGRGGRRWPTHLRRVGSVVGADGPTGTARRPLFVVTREAPEEVPDGGVYTFVDGIERALVQAKAAAADRDVAVMGGADIGQQYIRAGLVDKISIHLVPLLLAAIHAGDWLAKLLMIAVILGVWREGGRGSKGGR